jgi:hypothetical protein
MQIGPGGEPEDWYPIYMSEQIESLRRQAAAEPGRWRGVLDWLLGFHCFLACAGALIISLPIVALRAWWSSRRTAGSVSSSWETTNGRYNR